MASNACLIVMHSNNTKKPAAVSDRVKILKFNGVIAASVTMANKMVPEMTLY
jgi:hypothetical protein